MVWKLVITFNGITNRYALLQLRITSLSIVKHTYLCLPYCGDAKRETNIQCEQR